MFDERDYDDLKRDDIAVYNFRGYTVLKFDKGNFSLEVGQNATMCSLIVADFALMAKFLDDCAKFSKGKIEEVEHVEVN